MRISDLTVEVRDINLVRLGSISSDDIELKYTGEHNNVGTWELTLPSDHEWVGGVGDFPGDWTPSEGLTAYGSGIIVSARGEVLFSGPTVQPEFESTPENPDGSITFHGVTDTVILADMLAWPDPSQPDLNAQTFGGDRRSGPAETVMHEYVNANIGPDAPTSRRKAKLLMGADAGRGIVVSKRGRFHVLGELLTAIAAPSGLGFRIVQRGTYLYFDTYEIRNRTKEIRFDVEDGSLAGQKATYSAPGVTRVLAAGKGRLRNQTFFEQSTTASEAAENNWGRRIERYVYQKDTKDPVELEQAANEVLEQDGYTGFSFQAVPHEDELRRYGADWFLGDSVTIRMRQYPFDSEVYVTITGIVLMANAEGVKIGMTLGDAAAFGADAAASKREGQVQSRISALERDSGDGIDGNDEQITTDINGYATVTHNLGVVPLAITVNGSSHFANPAIFAPTDRTDATFRVHVRNHANNIEANATRNILWIAIA